jgi:CRP-like cAMP-binding protein
MTDFSKPEIPALGIMSTLEEEDRRLLGDYGEFLPIQSGDEVIHEGDAQDSLYFVISGLLHVVSFKDAKRTLLARVGSGETFGEVNFFDPGVASANVTAKEFTQIWKANRKDFEGFLKSYPAACGKLLMALLAELSQRIRTTNERLKTAELDAAVQSMWHF